MKTLHRHRENDLRARRRFRREAAAYETLEGLGPPRLLDDNADTWADRSKPMYLALEYIDGQNLQAFVRRNGPVGMEAALTCVAALADVLHLCHQNNVTHRDVKPANVVLRAGDITEPVLVDFGLSFNDEDEDDLTQIEEEVGNRFLRLPEHAFGGRGSASDVTQLAGVFLYTVTGLEPRVLLDSDGLMPHQRPEVRAALENHLGERERLRLMRVLDRAFRPELSARYATAPELVADLERAMTSETEDGDDLDRLIAQVDEFALSRNLPAQQERRQKLHALLTSMNRTVEAFATSKGLQRWQTRYKVTVTADEEWGATSLAITLDGQQPDFNEFKVDPRGPSEYVVTAEGQEIWRGGAFDQGLADAVTKLVLKRFLDRQSA
ncbi:protein kinase [Mycobacterium paraterrae]|uniref:non-specific serine/threonine protein kinase n=1 Tax=Mycobacterium paraterrae TaxID=577492 RepID=A0ABY3VXH9_9MYCO|nr:protein kinase [Mycobacterium paraterrae]UMB72207.1 protein kinase [Mycobacterium paraterrae]